MRFTMIPKGNGGSVAYYDIEDLESPLSDKVMCSATHENAVRIVTALNLFYDTKTTSHHDGV